MSLVLKGWRRPTGPRRETSRALLTCPACGSEVSIGRSTHEITAAGVVTPWVVCGTVRPSRSSQSCGFREFVKLDGWADREKS